MASSPTLIICSQAVLILLSVARLEAASSAASPSPSSSLSPTDCMSELLSLSGCLAFVQAGSTLAKPDSSCCSPLKKVVKEKPSCLCQAFGSGSTFGISLNVSKALSLPSACNVKTPSVSKCNLAVAGAPLGAPVHAPGTSPETSQSATSQGLSPVFSPSQPSSAATIFLPVPFNVLFLSALLLSVRSFLTL